MHDITKSTSSLAAQVRNSVGSALRAGYDAGRAWALAPPGYARTSHGLHAEGGWTLKSQRPYRLHELLRIKYKTTKRVFRNSLRIRSAPAVVIPRNGTEGLIANLLHVIEVLHRVRPGASVYVDWKLVGDEIGFRYGKIGSDVWSGLFRPIGTSPAPPAFRANLAVDYSLLGTGRDRLSGRALRNQRETYHRTIAKWIEISNRNVLERTGRLYEEFLEGRFCVGVHRRVGNAQVANLQKDGKIPPISTLISRCEELLQKSESSDGRIFLATDDADAVDAFKGTFGTRLVVQDNVKRTVASRAEVHFGDWRSISLTDAEDVLVDTLLLSRCNVLVHASSSVSTMAAFLNPNLTLVRV